MSTVLTTLEEENIITTRVLGGTVLLDTLGMLGGYVLGPEFGLSPLYGLVAGVLVANVLFICWIGYRLQNV